MPTASAGLSCEARLLLPRCCRPPLGYVRQHVCAHASITRARHVGHQDAVLSVLIPAGPEPLTRARLHTNRRRVPRGIPLQGWARSAFSRKSVHRGQGLPCSSWTLLPSRLGCLCTLPSRPRLRCVCNVTCKCVFVQMCVCASEERTQLLSASAMP